MQLENDPNPSALAGDAIKSYLNEAGTHFARDFWMHNRMGAQAGASVRDYVQALVILGRGGFFSYDGDDADDVGDGNGRTIHNYVMGPDDPAKLWNETMTSPGTLGWNPLGAIYQYIGGARDEGINLAAWEQAGCPKRNAFGDWADGGKPAAVVAWGRMSIPERANAPWPWASGGRRRRR